MAGAQHGGANPWLGILTGFLPWVVYWILVGNVDFRVAVSVACALSLATAAVPLLHGRRPKGLETGAAIAFVLLLVVTFATDDGFLERWIQPLTNGALLATVLAGLALGRPFTAEYAREEVEEDVAASAGFAFINRVVTGVWAGAFAVMTASSVVPPLVEGDATIRDGGSTLSIACYWVVPVVALALAGLVSARFPDWFVSGLESIGTPVAEPPPLPDLAAAGPPMTATMAAPGGQRIALWPPDGLVDAAVVAVAGGFAPATELHVRARTVDALGAVWTSEATYAADGEGALDTSRAAATGGTYDGVDPSGLVWSMRMPAEQTPRLYVPPVDPAAVVVEVEDPGSGALVAATAVRRARAADVDVLDVVTPDLTARLYLPPGDGPHPGVVLFPGSEGGLDSQALAAGLLASHGFASLVVAYVGAPGRPPSIADVPLEGFAAGVDWLRAHAAVDRERIAAVGTSKGAEGLLAAAAHLDLGLRGLVLVSPSSAVWQAIGEHGPAPDRSSWTLAGEPLPFVPMDGAALMPGLLRTVATAGRHRHRHEPVLMHLAPAYTGADLDAAGDAEIPAERVEAPLLLLAGSADELWPSVTMARRVASRRQAGAVGGDDELVVYPEAGHLIRFGLLPTQAVWAGGVAFGGTARGLARAQADATQRLVAFLGRRVGAGVHAG